MCACVCVFHFDQHLCVSKDGKNGTLCSESDLLVKCVSLRVCESVCVCVCMLTF